ncbi:MAG: adenylate/guanylate cyclase domain-containing protein [Proteobacteria bacterium]|nr:adenylate/guanylate cyclase domain-containing protein [Pseudomonadota bacterium]
MMSDQSSIDHSAATRLRQSFAEESRNGIMHATAARSLALLAFAGWVLLIQDFPRAWFYIGLLTALLVAGIAHGFVAIRMAPRIWPSMIFMLADSCLLAYALAAPNPFMAAPLPAPLGLRLGNFSFFYALLAASFLTYSPRLVLWCGITGAATWVGAVAWIANLPDSRTQFDIVGWDALGPAGHVPFRMDPHFVATTQHVKEAFIFLVVASILATVVWRARRLALRHAMAERERANLARHFSPNMVDMLASSDEPLGAVRRQKVAVLFADIVGFSGLAEQLGPERTMDLLRKTHSLIAEQIFAHGGTLDKYIGDAVMATFGVPTIGPEDAANAVACARSIREALAANNPLEGDPVKVGIGAHFGEVVIGDIGDERRVEFGVIGDTVNVASRLEGLTRDLGPIVVSDELFTAAGLTGPDVDGFRRLSEQKLRGRKEPIDIWVLDNVPL